MLIRTVEELSMYLPTHVLSNLDSISGFIEQSEQAFVLPALGKPLADKLAEEYGQMNTMDLIPSCGVIQTPWMQLVKKVQCAAVFNAMYESAGIINVSINDGNGMADYSTDGMGQSKDKTIENFKKSVRYKAHQALDQLLVFLEEDACSDVPIFKELWQKSKWYYSNNAHLIHTAITFNHFVDIYESREKFISLLPDIIYCEDMYLRPEIGDELLDALIEVASNKEIKDVQAKAIYHLRRALALFVEHRNKMFTRADAGTDATLSMARAKSYIVAHQDDFLPEVKSSPFYVDPTAIPQERKAWENNKKGDQVFVTRRM